MAKSLVIVESPSKAKTINKYLGKDYVVEATVGHIKNLPKSKISVDLENGFVPTYEIIKGKEKVIKDIQRHAKVADKIYIATDPDREGEAIASDIVECVEKYNKKIKRVLFEEITKTGVAKAMENPTDIDTNLVESQQARRVMDRILGYKVSPFLWKTFYFGLSAGRVQSIALKLISEKELEIRNFKPKEYWTIDGTFSKISGEKIYFSMKAFLVGLLVLVMALFLSGVGILLFPLLLVLGVFLRLLVGIAILILAVWMIGWLTLLLIDALKGKEDPQD